MAERDQNDTRRGFPDLLTGLAGIGTLLVSAFVLTDGAFEIPNPTWLLAGGALLVGILLLASSLRGKR
ncbi:hypothetical protein [Actinophytocola glycyrrhizae]|uniref:Secreted protein with PEP-CTERM sorting signal n=1 Tax=Actinophytocola glycyrrhizae TaxID=2044873 RepID=A0ABV9RXJ0_9PSEU